MSEQATDFEHAPQRLLDGDDAVGKLLRQYATNPCDAPCPFALLVERARRNDSLRRGAWLLAAATLCGVLGWSILAPRTSTSLISAESIATLAAPERPKTEAQVEEASRASVQDASVPRRSAEETDQGAVSPVLRPRIQSTSSPSGSGTPRWGAKPTTSKGCAEMAQKGAYDDALACYAKKSQDTTMSSELALIESARIHWKARGGADQALVQLDEYQRRFSGGALALEAAVLKTKILSSAGRPDEALRYVRAAASSSATLATHLVPMGISLALTTGRCDEARQLATDFQHEQILIDTSRTSVCQANLATNPIDASDQGTHKTTTN